MDPKIKLAQLQAEADELLKKSATPDFTAEDADRAEALVTEIAELKALIGKREAATKGLLAAVAKAGTSEDPADTDDAPAPVSLGQAFVESEAYKAFRQANPKGVTKGSPIAIAAKFASMREKARKGTTVRKLLTTSDSDAAPTRLPGIEDVTYRQPNTLLDFVTVGTTDSPWLQYRQLVSFTSNASIVPEATATDGVGIAGGVKPLSDLTTQTADAKAFTYADGIEATTQELSDDGALAALLDGFLTKNVYDEIERVLFEGDEGSDEPDGILNTTGVLRQTFTTDAVTSIRKAKTLLQTTSNANIQAIGLNPEDDEALDLLQDQNLRYYGNGPFGTGPNTIWAVPRFTSSKIPAGMAVMGEWNHIQLLILEALQVLAFNQHKDYAQRNLVYIRAEMRALQLIRQPAKLAIVELEAGS